MPDLGRMAKYLVISAVCTFVFGAYAQEDLNDCPEVDENTDTDEAKKLAGKLFSEGESHFQNEEYDAALGKFLCSISIIEHPVTLYNAAQAAFHGGNHEQTRELANRCIELDPEGVGLKAEELIAQLPEPTPEADDTVVVGPMADESGAGTQTTRDDTQTIPDDNQTTDEETRSVQETDSNEAPEHDDTPNESEIQIPAREIMHEPETAAQAQRPAGGLAVPGYVALSMAGVSLVAGITLQSMTGVMHTDSQSTDNPDVFAEKRRLGEATQSVAIGSFVVGGVSLGMGIVFLLLDHKLKVTDTDLAVKPGLSGIVLEGRF